MLNWHGSSQHLTNSANNHTKLLQLTLSFYHQNPKNCETSKRLLCTDHQKCGMGCQLHWVMYCFIAAYNTNRTLIIDKSVLNNYNEEGWNSVFEGVSGNCTSVEGGSVIEWKGLCFSNSYGENYDFKTIFYANR